MLLLLLLLGFSLSGNFQPASSGFFSVRVNIKAVQMEVNAQQLNSCLTQVQVRGKRTDMLAPEPYRHVPCKAHPTDMPSKGEKPPIFMAIEANLLER